jgi:hypothetical protein
VDVKRILAILGVVLLAGCASGPARTAEPISWSPGRYMLEGSVTTMAGGMNSQEQHTADLLILSTGEMTMFSSSGVCVDPAPVAVGADAARGRRTFLCGEVRYELQPAGTTVRGRLFTTVIREERTTVCVRYVVNQQGERVCAETQEKIERVQVPASAQLLVRPRA